MTKNTTQITETTATIAVYQRHPIKHWKRSTRRERSCPPDPKNFTNIATQTNKNRVHITQITKVTTQTTKITIQTTTFTTQIAQIVWWGTRSRRRACQGRSSPLNYQTYTYIIYVYMYTYIYIYIYIYVYIMTTQTNEIGTQITKKAEEGAPGKVFATPTPRERDLY